MHDDQALYVRNQAAALTDAARRGDDLSGCRILSHLLAEGADVEETAEAVVEAVAGVHPWRERDSFADARLRQTLISDFQAIKAEMAAARQAEGGLEAGG